MGWWKADPAADTPKQTPPIVDQSSKSSALPQNAAECPVDSKTRQIWLQQAQRQPRASQDATLPHDHPAQPQQSRNVATQRFAITPSKECSSDRIDQGSGTSPVAGFKNTGPLSIEREVSSIPRAYPISQTDHGNIPSNSETETGHDKSSGNWIYPSESQFFTAVMRKQSQSTSPAELASSISSIIPIHNAVNERAWSMIRKWESDHPSNKSCGGPKLLRFEGKGAGAKSPRAIMKSWSGYQEPFDRHDWTVQRCDGTEVEYIIDFYQGRSPAGQVSGASQGAPASGMGGINFYLDVRPKLNSIEGCRLRFEKAVGLK